MLLVNNYLLYKRKKTFLVMSKFLLVTFVASVNKIVNNNLYYIIFKFYLKIAKKKKENFKVKNHVYIILINKLYIYNIYNSNK